MIIIDMIIRDITSKIILLSRFEINTCAPQASHNVHEYYVYCSIRVSIQKLLKVDTDLRTNPCMYINMCICVWAYLRAWESLLRMASTNAVLSLAHTYTHVAHALNNQYISHKHNMENIFEHIQWSTQHIFNINILRSIQLWIHYQIHQPPASHLSFGITNAPYATGVNINVPPAWSQIAQANTSRCWLLQICRIWIHVCVYGLTTRYLYW